MRKKTQSEFCRFCTKKPVAHNLCWAHYAIIRRRGTIEKKKKSIFCKLCPAGRYKFNGGESNLCKRHISIYRKERYQRMKNFTGSSELGGINAKDGLTASAETSKTSADDSVSVRPPISGQSNKRGDQTK